MGQFVLVSQGDAYTIFKVVGSPQDVCKEVAGAVGYRGIQHGGWLAFLDDFAIRHEHDMVGGLAGESYLVCHHKQGKPPFLQSFQNLQYLVF